MSGFIPLSVPNFGAREAELAGLAITSGWVSTSGGKVTEFEEKLAAYVGMPRAVACNAGTSALHLAAMAAGITRGDEVIVPTLTFIAAVNPLTRYVGAEPIFIGCDDSLCIDPDAVEDFCANHCELRDGKLYNKKTGAGGAVVSNHADWAEHAKHLSTQAKADMLQFLHDEVGYNYRMTNVQASLGIAQLERLEGFIAHKKELYDRYAAALDGVKGLRILPFREEACRSNHWFFSLYVKDAGLDRDTVIEKLQAQQIQTRPVWALIHEQADYPRNEAYGLDKALDYRKYIVNLPCSTNLSMEDCDRVIEAVLGLLK